MPPSSRPAPPRFGLTAERRNLLRYARTVATVLACVVGASLAITSVRSGLNAVSVTPVMVDGTVHYALSCRYKLLFAQHSVTLTPAASEAAQIDRTRCPPAYDDARRMALVQ